MNLIDFIMFRSISSSSSCAWVL